MPKNDKVKEEVGSLHRSLVDKSLNSAHITEVIESIMDRFGGPNKFAFEFYREYLNAPEASAQKTKMLETMLQLLKFSAQQGESYREDDPSLISDADLQDQILQMMPKTDAD